MYFTRYFEMLWSLFACFIEMKYDFFNQSYIVIRPTEGNYEDEDASRSIMQVSGFFFGV